MNTYKSPNEIVRESRMNRRVSFKLVKSNRPTRISEGVKINRPNENKIKRSAKRNNISRINNNNNINRRINNNNTPGNNNQSRNNLRNRRNYNNNLTNRKQNQNSRLYISNLPLNITNSELSKLFENIGPLRRCGIHLNENQKTNGTADVEFVYSEDARRAIEEYNGRTLGGRPIVINWKTNRGNLIKRNVVRRNNRNISTQSNNKRFQNNSNNRRNPLPRNRLGNRRQINSKANK